MCVKVSKARQVEPARRVCMSTPFAYRIFVWSVLVESFERRLEIVVKQIVCGGGS